MLSIGIGRYATQFPHYEYDTLTSKTFDAFLRHQFQKLPGEIFVREGHYTLLSAQTLEPLVPRRYSTPRLCFDPYWVQAVTFSFFFWLFL